MKAGITRGRCGMTAPAGPTQVTVKRILLPTDFSPYAEAAVRWADALSQAFGAELVIVHALD
ncbi:MAG: universal stress protein, partial [Candidatus Rokuibacteriota bacterium]